MCVASESDFHTEIMSDGRGFVEDSWRFEKSGELAGSFQDANSITELKERDQLMSRI